MGDKKNTAKLLLNAASEFIKIVGNSSYQMWERKDFRLYLDFDHLEQVEQDRIFNELQVSVLGLFLLNFDHAVAVATDEKQVVLRAFRKDLVPAFLNVFTELGLDKKFVDQWEKLIDLRLAEYRKDLKTALKESVRMVEFENEDGLRIVWARVETITIDCLDHIRRGDVKKDDPLWELLRKWFITLDSHATPITGDAV